jgi:hypothetical protein
MRKPVIPGPTTGCKPRLRAGRIPGFARRGKEIVFRLFGTRRRSRTNQPDRREGLDSNQSDLRLKYSHNPWLMETIAREDVLINGS